jgi:hypothetical protein
MNVIYCALSTSIRVVIYSSDEQFIEFVVDLIGREGSCAGDYRQLLYTKEYDALDFEYRALFEYVPPLFFEPYDRTLREYYNRGRCKRLVIDGDRRTYEKLLTIMRRVGDVRKDTKNSILSRYRGDYRVENIRCDIVTPFRVQSLLQICKFNLRNYDTDKIMKEYLATKFD